MATNQKDTVYIDIDDEITSIIEKVRSSDQKIVALVLPKRAAVLQSIVNMKLLKRSAEQVKKHVVLITSETALLPLAGAVGMHVAPSLQSRPAIPAAPSGMGPDPDSADDFDADALADKPVGQLAPAAFAAKPADDMETIELDNDSDSITPAAAPLAGGGLTASAATGVAVAGVAQATKPKKNNKLKVPDFNKFRLAIVLGSLLFVGLLVFGYFALFVMPKATVTIKTDSSDIPTNETITLDPTADTYDPEDKVLPAKIETKQLTSTQQAAATGQKNNGQKATGTVTMTAQVCGAVQPADDVPAGTGVSSGGKTYITKQSTSFSASGKPINGCINFKADSDTDVVAQAAGAAYNIEPASFTVAGRKDVAAKSSDAMSGGTDEIIKVVSQQDIANAKQKLTAGNSSSAKNDLQNKLEDEGYTAVAASLKAADPSVSSSANAGDQADTVTVTSNTNYTMYGYKKDDLRDLVLANVKTKINPSKQKILDDGISKASFTITSPASSGSLQAALSVTSLAGPDLKVDSLKSQIAGKKTNDVRTTATATPGVTDVNVKYSPFWVHSVPKKTDRITIVIEKVATTSNANKP